MLVIVRRRRLIRVLAAGLFLGFQLTIGVVTVVTAGPDQDLPTVIVAVDRGELAVDVRNAPLAQVLRIIGEQAGVKVALHGDLSAPVTQSFAGLPLEEGIRRLAGGHSVAVAYGAGASGSGHAGLTGVWVMGRSSPRASSLESGPSLLQKEQADASVAEAAGDSPLAPPIGEIQRLAGDADRGSEAAMARLAEIGASDADAALRQQAVAALGRLTGSAVEPVLVAALADTDVEVRLRAVRGLRRFGTDTAVQSIAEVSLGDADPHVRLAAVTALTSLPGGSMLRGLAKASSDPDDVVRGAAIRGLAWWNTRWPTAR